jgi:hypothetical protein
MTIEQFSEGARVVLALFIGCAGVGLLVSHALGYVADWRPGAVVCAAGLVALDPGRLTIREVSFYGFHLRRESRRAASEDLGLRRRQLDDAGVPAVAPPVEART